MVIAFIMCNNDLLGQNKIDNFLERKDTLQTIIVTADSLVVRPTGVLKVDLPQMQHMVSVLGEGDVIKYIQTMPGVSAG